MRRKRGRKPKDEIQILINDDEQIQQIGDGPFITDLPRSVVQEILLKLPIKSILMCKIVCKTWHCVISDPEFTHMHFHLNQEEAYPMIRPWHRLRVGRTLYLVQPAENSGFDLEDHTNDNGTLKSIPWPVRMSITNCKIPLRNPEEAFKYHNKLVDYMLNRKRGAKKKHRPCINDINPLDHRYELVNSCNGLLCLAEEHNGPSVVCNPITGEFIHLPHVLKNESHKKCIGGGFGFSPKTNKYKVIRVLHEGADHPIQVVDIEIHTLGTHSWKEVGSSPFAEHMKSPIYLKGALYWYSILDSIASFDLDTELFQSVPPLPFQVDYLERGMGVLGESLSVCATHDNQIDVGEVEDHGAQMSWKKKVYDDIDVGGRQSWPQRLYIPLKYLTDGALLMFKRDTDALVYYHPRRNYRSILYLDLKIRGRYREGFEVIRHVPSLMSLKDIEHDLEVLNVYSRCAEYKLPRETRGLQLKTLWW
ncbi:hypothetical protein ACLB2K_066441 [Fragaria x ananassa]